jgi:hypothetical protein
LLTINTKEETEKDYQTLIKLKLQNETLWSTEMFNYKKHLDSLQLFLNGVSKSKQMLIL